jgi:hypothetical protein
MAGMSEGILTTCYGPAPYRRLAVTLARCLAMHAPQTPRIVATDAPDAPELRRHFDEVVPLRPEFGDVFVQKLHLHRYSPFHRTLYIDSDSLVVRPLDETWGAFRGRSFGVVGYEFSWNHWFDSKRLPPERQFPRYTLFNGGLLYFEREGAAVFEDAASLLPHYSDWEIVRNHGHISDEPLLAIAMASAGLAGVEDEGRIMRTLVGVKGTVRVDVLRGQSRFQKYGELVSPAIVHFAAGSWQMLEYRREAARLALHERGVPCSVLAALPPLTRALATAARPLRRGRAAGASIATQSPESRSS